MQYFRLQIGCLAVLLYVAVVYFQGCAKYRCRVTASHFWKLLILGAATIIADGATAWVLGPETDAPPLYSYIFTPFHS